VGWALIRSERLQGNSYRLSFRCGA
jgi:hypothetical protein